MSCLRALNNKKTLKAPVQLESILRIRNLEFVLRLPVTTELLVWMSGNYRNDY